MAVLLGKAENYRTRTDGKIEKLQSFLLLNALTFYRDPLGVDSDIFFKWAQNFVLETEVLHTKHDYILVTLDGYGAYCTFRVLQLSKKNKIVVVGLPSHNKSPHTSS